MKLHSPIKAELRNSPIHGWGVFAKTVIFKDELIEECPVYTLHTKAGNDWCPGVFDSYKFAYPYGATPEETTEFVLPLGWGAIYNHSNTPNAAWRSHPLNSRIYQWFALRDIYPDEEIFTYYGPSDYFEQLGYEPK